MIGVNAMRELPEPAAPQVLAFGRRAFWWALGTFVGGTLCWVVWGALTPGDYFGNGSLWVLPSLVTAGAAGGYVGSRTRSRGRGLRITLSVFGALFLLFWIRAPDGWWAKPPRRMPRPVPTEQTR